MKIAIGADHRGFEHKEYIKKYTRINNVSIEWIDVGVYTTERSDYPLYASHVAELVTTSAVGRGILVCGSGIGMAIVANRYNGVYAGVVWNEEVARFAAEHDKVNVLSIPSDFVSEKEAVLVVQTWLTSHFLGGRYQQRIDLIDKIK